MDITEIEARIHQIDFEIRKLQAERAKLENDILISDLDFEHKFKFWADNSEGGTLDSLPRASEYPFIRKMIQKEIDQAYIDRYRTYNLFNLFESEIYTVMYEENHKKTYTPAQIENIKGMCKEMMENDIKSFTCDW